MLDNQEKIKHLRKALVDLSKLAQELNISEEIILQPKTNTVYISGVPNVIQLPDDIVKCQESSSDYIDLAKKGFHKSEWEIAHGLLFRATMKLIEQLALKSGQEFFTQETILLTAEKYWGEKLSKSAKIIEACKVIDIGKTNNTLIFERQLTAHSVLKEAIAREVYYTSRL